MSTTVEVLASANDLLAEHAALVNRVKSTQDIHHRLVRALGHEPVAYTPPSPVPSPSPPSSPLLPPAPRIPRPDLPPAKRARVGRYASYVPEEETIRNDYSQRYVDSGDWPQNWVLGAEPERRFEEFPKQQRLLMLKKASVDNYATPLMYLPSTAVETLLPSKFDVILIDPPFSATFGWSDLQNLPVPQLAADPSFVFLWVGSGAGDGLERGREALANWGYRRCEDVVWLKTNTSNNQGPGTDPPTTSLLTPTKQHCLMGIRGTVRRSTDNWFAHCNIDTDVIIWPGDPLHPQRKPPEMYTLIENFCLGTRRLELFGRSGSSSSLRRGWVTVLNPDDSEHETIKEGTPWERETWETAVQHLANGGPAVIPQSQEIEMLRPKSPFRPGAGGAAGRGGGGVGGSGGRQQQQQVVPQQQQMMMAPQAMMPMGMGIPMGMGMGMDPMWMMNMHMMMAQAQAQAQQQQQGFGFGMPWDGGQQAQQAQIMAQQQQFIDAFQAQQGGFPQQGQFGGEQQFGGNPGGQQGWTGGF